MRCYFILATLVVAAVLLCGGCATTPTSELSQLQGNWAGEELGGQKGVCRMTIESDTVRFQGALRQDWYIGTLTLDPKARPKQATMLISDCGFRQHVNKTAKGIYKLEGNRLTLAAHEPGIETVPTALAHDAASQTRAFVFTRQ